MMPRSAYVEFVTLPTFERTAKGLLNEEDRRLLEIELLENAERGAVMPGTGGFRKLRFAVGKRGKRGGVRVIYYYFATRERVYLVLAYPKNVKDSLTDAERAALRRIASSL